MLPVVMGPHTVGKASQPSFSIKGRSKLGSFSDDLHKARVTWLGHSTAYPLERWPIWSLPPDPRAYQPDPHPPEAPKLFLLWEPATYLAPPSLGYIPEVRRGRQWTRMQEVKTRPGG